MSELSGETPRAVPSKSPLSWSTLFGWSSGEPAEHTSTSSAAAATMDAGVDAEEPVRGTHTDGSSGRASPIDRDCDSPLLQQDCFADIDSDDAVEEEMLECLLIKCADKRQRPRMQQQQNRAGSSSRGRRRSRSSPRSAGGDGSAQRELCGAAAEQRQPRKQYAESKLMLSPAATASATATEPAMSPDTSTRSARSPSSRIASGRRSNSISSSGGTAFLDPNADAGAGAGAGAANGAGERHVELLRMLRLHVTATTERELELDGRLQDMGRKCDRLEESLKFIVHSKLRGSHDYGVASGAGGATVGDSSTKSGVASGEGRHERSGSGDSGRVLSPASCRSSGSGGRSSSSSGVSGHRRGGALAEGCAGGEEELYEYASGSEGCEEGSEGGGDSFASGTSWGMRGRSGWTSWKLWGIGLVVQLALLVALVVASKLVVVDLEQALEGLSPPLGCGGYRPFAATAMSMSEPFSGLGAGEHVGCGPGNDLEESARVPLGDREAGVEGTVGPSYRGSLWGAVADTVQRPLRSFSPPRLTS